MSAGPVRLTRVRALLAAGGFAVVALVVAGCASTIGGSGQLAGGGPTDDPTTKSTKSTSKSTSKSADFPDPTATRSTSTSASRSSSTSASSTRTSSSPSPDSTDAALKAQLADTGEKWVHAYAAPDVPAFCALSDPPSLQALLDEKGIASCDTLTITWDTDLDLKAQLAAYDIPDPNDILIIGSSAFVLSFDVTPANLFGITWIKQADGSWKVDASTLSNN